MSLEQYVLQAQKNDLQAFAKIADSTKNDLYFYAYRTMNDRNAADFCLKKVYQVCFSKIDTVKNPRVFENTLKLGMYKNIVNFLKKNDLWNSDLMSHNNDFLVSKQKMNMAKDAEFFIPDQQINYQSDIINVHKTLDHMSYVQRMLVIMVYFDRIPLQAVKSVTGLNEGMIDNILAEARESFVNSLTISEQKMPFVVWVLQKQKKELIVPNVSIN